MSTGPKSNPVSGIFVEPTLLLAFGENKDCSNGIIEATAGDKDEEWLTPDEIEKNAESLVKICKFTDKEALQKETRKYVLGSYLKAFNAPGKNHNHSNHNNEPPTESTNINIKLLQTLYGLKKMNMEEKEMAQFILPALEKDIYLVRREALRIVYNMKDAKDAFGDKFDGVFEKIKDMAFNDDDANLRNIAKSALEKNCGKNEQCISIIEKIKLNEGMSANIGLYKRALESLEDENDAKILVEAVNKTIVPHISKDICPRVLRELKSLLEDMMKYTSKSVKECAGKVLENL